jgi:hypothetical protein
MARVMRAGVRHQENFGLTKYAGSWKDAEKAASAWVAAKLAELPPITTNEGVLSLRNTSGEVGVCLGRSRFHRKGKQHHTYFRWVARWPGCALKGGLAWSWQQYGDDDAYVLAVLSRRLRTVDRTVVLTRLAQIKGTRDYTRILAQWAR